MDLLIFKDIMESFRDDSVQDSSLIKPQDSFQAETFEPTKPNLKNIRPLTQAYQSPSGQAQVCVSKRLCFVYVAAKVGNQRM